jgi:hypothetical protein
MHAQENNDEETNHFETLVRDLFSMVCPDVIDDLLRTCIVKGIEYETLMPNDTKDLHLIHAFFKDLEFRIGLIDQFNQANKN